jgi:hypothetical protein
MRLGALETAVEGWGRRKDTAIPAALKSLTQAREQPAGKPCSSVTDI